ncbi:hypothetical protein PMAYCL1PPCAC_05295, partial [Pristionchus mayeri]
MYDKCYVFPKDKDLNNILQGKYVKGTMTDYANNNLCHGGKLSVFYSSTHAKFVGMKAHSLGIDKLWIGIDKEGKSIEKDKDGKNIMIHSKLWKLVEGDYWADGETLKKFEKDKAIPADATHYFMRTRTDYLNNRWQGSFERANGAKF